METLDPRTRRLHSHEVRALAAIALAATAVYGAFIGAFGVGFAVECSRGAGFCAEETWLPPALGLATAIALLSVYRAVPALWAAARTSDRRRGPFRRFLVAWFGVLPWGALTVWPGVAQVLYTGLALPAIPAFLLLSRAAIVVLRRARHPPR